MMTNDELQATVIALMTAHKMPCKFMWHSEYGMVFAVEYRSTPKKAAAVVSAKGEAKLDALRKLHNFQHNALCDMQVDAQARLSGMAIDYVMPHDGMGGWLHVEPIEGPATVSWAADPNEMAPKALPLAPGARPRYAGLWAG